jgi:hypothetical protein
MKIAEEGSQVLFLFLQFLHKRFAFLDQIFLLFDCLEIGKVRGREGKGRRADQVILFAHLFCRLRIFCHLFLNRIEMGVSRWKSSNEEHL